MKNQTDRKRTAAANFWLLASVASALMVLGGWIYWRQTRQQVVEVVAPAAPGVVLSETTTKILAGLETSVELRLFAPNDGKILPAVLADYLGRVEMLLAEYERVAGGKLRVTKSDPQTDAAAKTAAGAAGVMPFVSESGEIVYLGLTVGSGARSESIFPLAPEWEAALESDVTRAITRITAKLARPVSAVAQTTTQPAAIDPAISEELLRAFPDLATRSFDDIAKVLRERALEEFKKAAAEMQTKVAEAQKALAETQANKNEAAQLTAGKELQRIQAEQTDKLKGITARLQEQIPVLQQLKTASAASGLAQ